MDLQPQHTRPWLGLPRLRERWARPTALRPLCLASSLVLGILDPTPRYMGRSFQPDQIPISLHLELSTRSRWIDWSGNVADQAIVSAHDHHPTSPLLSTSVNCCRQKVAYTPQPYKSFHLEPINYRHQLYKGNMSSDSKQKDFNVLVLINFTILQFEEPLLGCKKTCSL